MSVGEHDARPHHTLIGRLEHLLNLRHGDLGRGMLLFAYLFLTICSYVIGKVARDALFLARFQARQLPYADITVAVLIGFVVAAYVRISRHTSVRNLLVGSMLFFSANCIAFWLLAHLYHASWLYPVLYIWVGIFGVLAPAQVWTLANYVLTTREARRAFGVVGSGAIVGWIFAGYFTTRLVKAFGTESLLVAMAVFLAMCAALIIEIWRRAAAHTAELDSDGRGSEGPRNLRESIRLIAVSPYLRTIAAVIFLSSLATTMIGWQFKAVAKDFMPNKEALAIFFGNFNLYAGLLSLAVQLLLTSRFLRRFGIGPALFAVPVALLASSTGFALSGGLISVVLLKGADQVLRYSIDKSSVELLYLPLVTSVKLQVKWFIDTVIWRFGDGLAGVILLVLVTYLHVPAMRLSWIIMVFIGCWIVAALLARRFYVETLKTSIQEHRIEVERNTAAVWDRAAAEIISEKLHGPSADEILYALDVLDLERRSAPHPAVRSLLSHESPKIRCRALKILAGAGDKSILPQVQTLLTDADLGVRSEALLYLSQHSRIDPLAVIERLGDFADFSIRAGVVAFLCREGETENIEAARQILAAIAADPSPHSRLEAARLLRSLPDRFDPQLSGLLHDPEGEVVREAIRSAGALRKNALVPALLARLGELRFAADAADALAAMGEPIVARLCDHLLDDAAPLPSRLEIPLILARIGTPDCLAALEDHLMDPDGTLRGRVATALDQLRQQNPALQPDMLAVETVLAAEIVGNYRSFQILEKIEAGSDDVTVSSALTENIAQEQERIFVLLNILYPRHDFRSTYKALLSSNATVHDNALEFLDNILKAGLRELVVPLLDPQISIAERCGIAARLAHIGIGSKEEAVAALIGCDDPWLRSCGVYAVGMLHLSNLGDQLASCVNDPDPLVRQTAIKALEQLQPQAAAVRA